VGQGTFVLWLTESCIILKGRLREEHRLRVFENRVLMRIFGPKRNKVKGGLRELHFDDLQNLCTSPIIIKMNM
jgi:hypothetical protein